MGKACFLFLVSLLSFLPWRIQMSLNAMAFDIPRLARIASDAHSVSWQICTHANYGKDKRKFRAETPKIWQAVVSQNFWNETQIMMDVCNGGVCRRVFSCAFGVSETRSFAKIFDSASACEESLVFSIRNMGIGIPKDPSSRLQVFSPNKPWH